MIGTENLDQDHVHIIAALDAVDASVGLAAQGIFSVPLFELIHHFIEVFADGAHYRKEELLFDTLAQQGMPEQLGPIACLSMEHEATRGQTRRIAHALSRINRGDDHARYELLDATSRYSAIVRVHLPKEDIGFFRMSERILSQEKLEELGAKFLEIDSALPGSIQTVAAEIRDTAAALGAAHPAQLVPVPAQPVELPGYSADTSEETRIDAVLRSLGRDAGAPFNFVPRFGRRRGS